MSDSQNQAPSPIAEIEQGPSAFEQFLDKNQGKLIIGGVLLILGLGSFVVVSEVGKAGNAKAASAFAAAHDIPSLQAVADDYAKTPAAGSALLKKAELQWEIGSQSDAIETLKNFLENHSKHPLLGSALVSLASKNLELGELEEAKKNFQAAVDLPTAKAVAPLALLSLGDIARREGKIEEARAYYERAKSGEYRDIAHTTITAADERIQLLNVAPPTEVEPVVQEGASELPALAPAEAPVELTLPGDAPRTLDLEEAAVVPTPEATEPPAEVPAVEEGGEQAEEAAAPAETEQEGASE